MFDIRIIFLTTIADSTVGTGLVYVRWTYSVIESKRFTVAGLHDNTCM